MFRLNNIYAFCFHGLFYVIGIMFFVSGSYGQNDKEKINSESNAACQFYPKLFFQKDKSNHNMMTYHCLAPSWEELKTKNFSFWSTKPSDSELLIPHVKCHIRDKETPQYLIWEYKHNDANPLWTKAVEIIQLKEQALV